MTKAITKVKKIENPITFWALSGMIALAAMLYAYFISNAVTQAVYLSDLSTDANALSSKIADLEQEYAFIASGLDESLASEKGFGSAKSGDIKYVRIDSGVAMVAGDSI